MGKNDSSLTRAVPVFDQLYKIDSSGRSWIPRLLKLPIGGNVMQLPLNCCFEIKDSGWGDNEKKLQPPVALLSWLIRYPRKPDNGNLSKDPVKAEKRRKWIEGSHDMIIQALHLLRHNPVGDDWHIFEGLTQPDIYIETDNLIIVLEGKRTEKEPTTKTRWMQGRNQMLRHLDCAWEIRGKKQLIGFFVVEGVGSSCEVPSKWLDFAKDTISNKIVTSSLPHRGQEEQQGIVSSFAGVTTWQQICKEFGIDWASLPDEVNK